MLSKILLILALITPAFQQSRVERAINFLRDDVVDSSHTTPPIVPPQVVSYVIHWHRGAITLVNSATPGWEKILEAQLDTLQTDLGATYKPLLQPDIDFIKSLLK